VFVVPTERLATSVVVVDGAEGRHAATVTRLAAGEAVVLVDGLGRRGEGVVVYTGRDVVEVDVTSVSERPAPQPRFVVVQALPKGDRGELAVESMTELGVDGIVPWAASRCVTRWRADRADKALARWRTSSRAAAKQSRRSRFPEVTGLATTSDVCRLLSGAALGAVLHESGTQPLADVALPVVGDVVLVVGPEGGVSDDELGAFREAGAETYRLGETVLRTSTAGVAALAVLSARSRWR
jgi:16S rRNA (uracil1498-N3)-methyltransferase